jgi:hypothetical protein
MTHARAISTQSRGSRRLATRSLLVVIGLAVSSALIAQATALAPVDRDRQASSLPPAQASGALRAGARSGGPTSRVTFRVTQATRFASQSEDQITIFFSDKSWEGTAPPYPLFGEDVMQEFSFSAIDIDPKRPLTFTRVVHDLTFLDARYIRVVNHGSEGWDGGMLALTIDGRVIFDKVAMQPRKGDPAKGLQDWNRKKWDNRTYWEADLQEISRRR